MQIIFQRFHKNQDLDNASVQFLLPVEKKPVVQKVCMDRYVVNDWIGLDHGV